MTMSGIRVSTIAAAAMEFARAPEPVARLQSAAIPGVQVATGTFPKRSVKKNTSRGGKTVTMGGGTSAN